MTLNKNTNTSFSKFKEIEDMSLNELYINALNLQQNNLLQDNELESLFQSILNVTNKVKDKDNAFVIRAAKLSDVDALYEMIKYWALKGENLPRSKSDLRRNILSFVVCVKEDVLVGCACLYVYDSGLAEIRSLNVSTFIQKQGQGRALVNFLLKKAFDMDIKKVFVLTRNPHFFKKVGFSETKISNLPEKILKDCDKCTKKDKCDEVAFEFNL